MPPRRRLTPERRRSELLEVGARMFAEHPYDEVLMEQVAERAGISRALLYRHFPTKRELFTAIYQQAADQLLSDAALDRTRPLREQLATALDKNIDYFAANRNTYLAANRTLAGDPTVQAIITGHHAAWREQLLDAAGLDGHERALTSAVLLSWLLFVHSLCVEWLEHQQFSRTELRTACVGALLGALPGEH
ncbi:TetR/AcrR family transcriptional regulator [Nocardia otitidiscaviarum]|uniref:TetR/AcrR family transcriptional regulator n=1 Tax=Nocardia otitidiscaviarum TaxID=1823 RepID=UPI00189493D5|nr:TetR/AcrR family transcriptional regulator [Nocardia otitidiscaviarum]MBF6182744.1 TetR/AcrR family transcriptional regulator [Nocardia otitidiscaviarum]